MPEQASSDNTPTIIHLHWVAFVRDIGILIAGIVLPPMILSFLIHAVVIGDVSVAIAHALPFMAALWALIVWMTAAVVWTKYYLSLWIITDKYLVYVNQANLFVRQIASWDLAMIKDVTATMTDPLSEQFDFGTVWIKTPEAKDTGGQIVATPIPHPMLMRDVIHSHLSIQVVAPAPGAAAPAPVTESVSEAQAELIRSISHEMKAHLTRSQVTFASIIAGDFGEVPKRVKDIAGLALADTREGVETVMDILNSANIKKGTLAMEKETFDLLQTVRENVDKFRPDAAKRGLSLRFNDKIGSCLIEGDRQKLSHHVFRNLIDNAIRYTPKGSIDVDLTWDSTYATFSTIDTGVGISPVDIGRLFTEGGKGTQSSRVNPASTGYGLYVARMVVEAHGGKIWVESDGPGHGSRFYVKLPLHSSK